MRIIFLATLCLFTSLPALAGDATTAADIRLITGQFLKQWAEAQAEAGYRIEYTIGNVDSRLSLAPCEGSPDITFASDPMQTTTPSVLVACAGTRPWRMYVTTNVEVYGNALVAARPLARGERLSDTAITTSQVQINASHRGTLNKPEAIAGMMVRRPVRTGTLITPDLLEAPNAIERGDHVIIVARSGSFSVSSRGKALASAGIGEQVLVENLRSSRTVRATAVAPGRVEIPM
ncbi:MAG TPA: flagellar basal body P-ring formation chaperone FlgA [Marinobacter sp.]|nr:flagellar basal body P-ring formation chaperone FlgA [Marinobacter sp.]